MEKVLNQPEMHPPHKDQGGGSFVVRLFFFVSSVQGHQAFDKWVEMVRSNPDTTKKFNKISIRKALTLARILPINKKFIDRISYLLVEHRHSHFCGILG